MGWDNPPVPWRELERRLSWDMTRQGGSEPAEVVQGRFGPQPDQDDGPPWAELHCHSSYSFLDGASSPAELVAEAARQGVQALALTDHDGMYGVAQFAQAAAQQAEQTGISLGTIFGAELSTGPGGRPGAGPAGRPPGTPRCASRPRGGTSPTGWPGGATPEPPGCASRPRGGTSPTHRRSPGPPARTAGRSRAPRRRSCCGARRHHRPLARAVGPGLAGPVRASARAGAADPEGEHLLVLARDAEGYRRLCAVISAAQLAGGEKGRPVYDRSALASAHDGHWAVLTGCRKGAVPAALAAGGPEAALRELRAMIAMFGPGNVMVELTFHDQPGDDERNEALARLAEAAGVGVVATGNVHYAVTVAVAAGGNARRDPCPAEPGRDGRLAARFRCRLHPVRRRDEPPAAAFPRCAEADGGAGPLLHVRFPRARAGPARLRRSRGLYRDVLAAGAGRRSRPRSATGRRAPSGSPEPTARSSTSSM